MKKAQGWFWDLPECQPRHLVTKAEAYSALSSHGVTLVLVFPMMVFERR